MSEITKDFIKLIAGLVVVLSVFSVLFADKGVLSNVFTFKTYAEPVSLLDHLAASITATSSCPGECSVSFKTSGMPYILKIYKQGNQYYASIDFRIVEQRTNVKYDAVDPKPLISDCEISEQEVYFTEGIIQDVVVKKTTEGDTCKIFLESKKEESDFNVTVSPETGYLMNGSSIQATVTVTLITQKTPPGNVKLMTSGEPSGVTIGFSKNNMLPTFTSEMTIHADSTAKAGKYTIYIQAQAENMLRTAVYELEVSAVEYRFSLDSRVDIINFLLEGVKVNTSNVTKFTRNNSPTSFNAVYGLLPGNYYVYVENPFENRSFSHYRDYDCDGKGNILDTNSSPYYFTIVNKTRDMVAFYKVLTQIRNLEFDSKTKIITGNLLDEDFNPIEKNRTRYSVCGGSITVNPNREVSIEYYDNCSGSWKPLGTAVSSFAQSQRLYDNFNDIRNWVPTGSWNVTDGELSNKGVGAESMQTVWNYWNSSSGENNNLEVSVKILAGDTVSVKILDATNSYYLQTNDSYSHVYLWVNGALKNSSTLTGVIPNQWNTWEIRQNESHLDFYINDKKLIMQDGVPTIQNGRIQLITSDTKAVFDNVTAYDGSWSYSFGSVCSARKIRVVYVPTDWYYNYTEAEIDIDPSTFPCKLTVLTQIDIDEVALPEVLVNVSDGVINSKFTKNTVGNPAIAEFYLAATPLNIHNITVNYSFSSRNFSHFYDNDCEAGNAGYWLDTEKNPYRFSMCRDKNITVQYKEITNITNTTGTNDVFEYNGSYIKGKLLNNIGGIIRVPDGNKHPLCENNTLATKVPINRNVTLEYYDVNDNLWYYINATNSSTTDGSWLYNWGCECGATKLRANYTPTSWYYMPESAEINIKCPCKVRVIAQIDALTNETYIASLSNVRVNVSNAINFTDISGIAEYILLPGSYYVQVENPFKTRPLSHLFDNDCDTKKGFLLDTTDNPYSFVMHNRTKNITAQYKAFTNITDTRGNIKTFEYNGTTIKGKLTDERGNALIDHGNKHPKCEDPLNPATYVAVNRNVTIESYNSTDSRWYNIGSPTVDSSDNVSWSINWNWSPETTKLRATYNPLPENWYYNYTSAEISLYRITVFTSLDIGGFPDNPPVLNVNATIDGIKKSSGANGKVDFFINQDKHNILVDSFSVDTLGLRPFSHFWNHDCNNLGSYQDNNTNPYSFTTWNKDRNISVFYKTFTFIKNFTGAVNTFDYNGITISGKLQDELGNSIGTTTSKALVCGNPSIVGLMYRNVTLEYFDSSWHALDSVSTSSIDGSWSYPWTCSCNTTKIRASYNHADWYYNSTSTEINIDPSLCPCKLTVFTFEDIPYLPTSNVQVNLDLLPAQNTNAFGATEFILTPGYHNVKVDGLSNAFSHFYDSDCSKSTLGLEADNATNPFTFEMMSKDRNLTAYYKISTNIANLAGVTNIFEYDGTNIKGKLLDKYGSIIRVADGNYHPTCGSPVSFISVNRNVSLEVLNSTDGKWYPIGANNSSIVDGSWSYKWSCSPGAIKLRANYTPTSWYYVGTNVEMNVGCTGTLEVYAFAGGVPVVADVGMGLGDVDQDEVVSVADLWYFDPANLNSCMDTIQGDPKWNPLCDMNLDKIINILDKQMVQDRQEKITRIDVTPFTKALDVGTYELRAVLYDKQIRNNLSVVISPGQTTRVDFNFLSCDGFSALNCSVPSVENATRGDIRNLTGNCGRANAKIDCFGSYNSKQFCNDSVPSLCKLSVPAISSYSVSSPTISVGESFSINANGNCPSDLPGNCLAECRVVHPDGHYIELDAWDNDGTATMPSVTCDQAGDYIVDYCLVGTDFIANRGWISINHTNTTVKCNPNCDIYDKGYDDSFNTAPQSQCPGYNYLSYSSASQMRDYYWNGTDCTCNVTHDSYITNACIGSTCGANDVSVSQNNYINVSASVMNTGKNDQDKWLLGVEFWNVTDYNNPGTRDPNTIAWASFNRFGGGSYCMNNLGVVPNCGCVYLEPPATKNGIFDVGETINVSCWMNASYWPVTSGNQRIMFWVHERDISQDAGNSGCEESDSRLDHCGTFAGQCLNGFIPGCYGGWWWNDSLTTKDASSIVRTIVTAPVVCTDPDLSDKTTQGTCTDGLGPHTDYCTSNTNICEYDCSGSSCSCTPTACPPATPLCSNGACVPAYNMRFKAQADIAGYVLPNVQATVDTTVGTTLADGTVMFQLPVGSHTISVLPQSGSRTFSHFWDSDCNPTTTGSYYDTTGSPFGTYSFTMHNRDRMDITAQYKTFTKITNYSNSGIIDDFSDGNYNLNPIWTIGCDATPWPVASMVNGFDGVPNSALKITSTGGTGFACAYTPFTAVGGRKISYACYGNICRLGIWNNSAYVNTKTCNVGTGQCNSGTPTDDLGTICPQNPTGWTICETTISEVPLLQSQNAWIYVYNDHTVNEYGVYDNIQESGSFEFDGTSIKGKLLDERDNLLIQQGGSHPTCIPQDTKIVPVDKSIKLEYNDGSWHTIGSPLFFDDFNDGDYSGWIKSGNWGILNGELNTSGSGDEQIQTSWSGWNNNDFTTLNIKLLSGSDVLVKIFDGTSSYYFQTWDSYGTLQLYVNGANVKSATLGGITPNSWNAWKINQSGSSIEVYINDVKRMDYNSAPLISNGGIQLRTLNSVAYFDDINVDGIEYRKDGSWLYDWKCVAGANKLRASYNPINWYYNSTAVEKALTCLPSCTGSNVYGCVQSGGSYCMNSCFTEGFSYWNCARGYDCPSGNCCCFCS